MNVGTLFLVISLILFALLGMGVAVIPRAEAWGWFFAVLGLLTERYPWPWRPR